MDSIEEIYNQVKNNLTVRHVMISADKLVFKDNKDYEKYDIVPIREGDRITHYYDTKTQETRKIEISHIISSHVDLIALLRCLKNQEFFFVKDCDKIIGFVNISNMNTKSPLRLLLFTLISNIEIKLKEICSEIVSSYSLKKHLTPDQWKDIEDKIDDDKKSNIDVDPYEYCDLRHYFTIIKGSEKIRQCLSTRDKEVISASQFKKRYGFISKFRNRIAHSSREALIANCKSETEYIEKLIDKIDRMNELLRMLVDARRRLRGESACP